MNSQALSGMTVGAAIMFLFGMVWLFFGLYKGRPSPGWLRMALLLAGIMLASWIGITIHRVSHVSERTTPLTTEQVATGRQNRRLFDWTAMIEGAAIILAVVILNAVGRPEFILSLIALIVGLHFFPLANLFGSPAYYGTGILGCAAGVVGFFISEPKLRTSVVGLSFGLMLWLTTTVMLAQVSLS
jgi:hypothetical protein